MTDQADASSVAIQPLLVVSDAERAIAFYRDVLGAQEKWRIMHYHRVGHAILRLADAEFIVLDEFPEAGLVGPSADGLSGPGVRLLVRVDDVDAVLRRAADNGATQVRDAQDQWWGVRSGSFVDPFGYRWSIRQVTDPIGSHEMQRRADELGLFPPPRAS